MYICQYKLLKKQYFCQFALIIVFTVQEMRLTFGKGAEWHHALSFQLFYKETEGGLILIAFVQRSQSHDTSMQVQL